ncbi:MAG: hypothetical protein KDC53_13580, partial [Saprospiraceae bacterium]|nr:hypothetical protein [Saprospiraceae bacterium]
ADGKWQWLDDTSSDEITGHLFSISLFIDYVAEGELKTRAIALIDRIVTNIIDHDFQLIDADGKPTRWGIWNPDSLNHSPNWSYEKGLNSLQILSFLRTAIHFTDKKAFKTAYQYLTESEGYADNAVQAKIYGPYETSHSDDILNFFPYYGLLKYGSDDPLRPKYIQSLARTWTAVQDDHMPVWNIMASAMLNRDCNLETAVRELQLYPLDLIDWTMNNSHRWDLTHDPLIDRGRKAQAVDPIPTPENQIFRWNTNPRRLDAGGNGSSEVSGTYFLVAYWMARYEGYITE